MSALFGARSGDEYGASRRVIDARLELEAVEYVRKAVLCERYGPIHDVEVQVRLGRFTGISNCAQHLTAADAIAHAHPQVARLQMSVQSIVPLVDLLDQVVTGGRFHVRVERRNLRSGRVSETDSCHAVGADKLLLSEQAG